MTAEAVQSAFVDEDAADQARSDLALAIPFIVSSIQPCAVHDPFRVEADDMIGCVECEAGCPLSPYNALALGYALAIGGEVLGDEISYARAGVPIAELPALSSLPPATWWMSDEWRDCYRTTTLRLYQRLCTGEHVAPVNPAEEIALRLALYDLANGELDAIIGSSPALAMLPASPHDGDWTLVAAHLLGGLLVDLALWPEELGLDLDDPLTAARWRFSMAEYTPAAWFEPFPPHRLAQRVA